MRSNESISLEWANSGLKRNLGCNELTNVICMSGCREVVSLDRLGRCSSCVIDSPAKFEVVHNDSIRVVLKTCTPV